MRYLGSYSNSNITLASDNQTEHHHLVAVRDSHPDCRAIVNYPFVGDVIDHLRIGRTAFYRYFPPDRIRELRNQA
jgi:hypothetical protein